MTILDYYDAICWHESSYSIIEDALRIIATGYPDTPLTEVMKAVAIAKLNARETRRSMRLDATRLLED